MFNYVVREGRLLIQAKTGLNSGLLVWSVFGLTAILLMFALLCLAFYFWLALQLGAVFGALAGAGAFLLLALIFVVAPAHRVAAPRNEQNSNGRSALLPHQRDCSIRNYSKREFRLAVQSAGNEYLRSCCWAPVPQPFCAGGRGRKKVDFGKLITGPSRSELRSSALAG